MIYLSGTIPSDSSVEEAILRKPIGFLMTPRSGFYSLEKMKKWSWWAADNGCFSSSWESEVWLRWLTRVSGVPGCFFAVVPDVVGDHLATLDLWNLWSQTVKNLGFTAAFVAQDGCTVDSVPWSEVGAIFLGGSTSFKLGENSRMITKYARSLGLQVHMGRVNSYKRLKLAVEWGCTSADGTFLAFGPDKNAPRMTAWFDKLDASNPGHQKHSGVGMPTLNLDARQECWGEYVL